jgi:hypothetical protein
MYNRGGDAEGWYTEGGTMLGHITKGECNKIGGMNRGGNNT